MQRKSVSLKTVVKLHGKSVNSARIIFIYNFDNSQQT